jgi:hypothetical protein
METNTEKSKKNHRCSVADPDPYVFGPPGPDPDPLVRDINPDPDPSIIKQKKKKNLDSHCFVTSF